MSQSEERAKAVERVVEAARRWDMTEDERTDADCTELENAIRALEALPPPERAGAAVTGTAFPAPIETAMLTNAGRRVMADALEELLKPIKDRLSRLEAPPAAHPLAQAAMEGFASADPPAVPDAPPLPRGVDFRSCTLCRWAGYDLEGHTAAAHIAYARATAAPPPVEGKKPSVDLEAEASALAHLVQGKSMSVVLKFLRPSLKGVAAAIEAETREKTIAACVAALRKRNYEDGSGDRAIDIIKALSQPPAAQGGGA